MDAQQVAAPGADEEGASGQEGKPKVGALVELTVRIPRKAYERLGTHNLKTGKSKARIVEELIMAHLPNWVIQLRRSEEERQVPAEKPEGQAKPSVKNVPIGETLTSSGKKQGGRQAG